MMANDANHFQRPALMPADTPDYMVDAWASCMSWAIGETKIREAFEKETGQRFVPAKSPFDVMIDQATGHDMAYVEAFIKWANLAIWGTLDGDDPDLE